MIHRLDPGCSHWPGFLVPKLALMSNMLAMVAVLLRRPRRLYLVLGSLRAPILCDRFIVIPSS
jgi:hypothetical protein